MGRALMDCQEVKELLDAYALGAAEKGEAKVLEQHVADCVRCWDELNEAERAAAMLLLAVAIEEAPAALRERIMGQAQRETRRGRRWAGLWPGLRRAWWPAASGALAGAAVAALALAAFLQVQMNDLRDENSHLERQVGDAGVALGTQRQILAVLAAPDTQELPMLASSPASQAVGVYYWSPGSRRGLIVGDNLPELREGQVYQVWIESGGETISAGTFESWNRIGQMPMDLSVFGRRPEGIGITVERTGGSDWPTGEMFLYASLEQH